MFNKKQVKNLQEKISDLETKKDDLYKENKQYLQRQQNIDYLLVLERFVSSMSLGNTEDEKELKKTSTKECLKIIESLK